MLLCGPSYREDVRSIHITYRKLNLIGIMLLKRKCKWTSVGLDRGLLFVCVTQGMTRLLASIYSELVLTQETRVSILKYSWRAVNIFMCILLVMHSLCTRQKTMSLFRDSRENTNMIVNLDMSCTVDKYSVYS